MGYSDFPAGIEELDSTTRSAHDRGASTNQRGLSQDDLGDTPRGFVSADTMESTMLRARTKRTDQELVALRRSVARNHEAA